MDNVRIVIEVTGNYQKDSASNLIDDIKQITMRRNPLEEPYIYVESRKSEKDQWEINNEIY